MKKILPSLEGKTWGVCLCQMHYQSTNTGKMNTFTLICLFLFPYNELNGLAVGIYVELQGYVEYN